MFFRRPASTSLRLLTWLESPLAERFGCTNPPGEPPGCTGPTSATLVTSCDEHLCLVGFSYALPQELPPGVAVTRDRGVSRHPRTLQRMARQREGHCPPNRCSELTELLTPLSPELTRPPKSLRPLRTPLTQTKTVSSMLLVKGTWPPRPRVPSPGRDLPQAFPERPALPPTPVSWCCFAPAVSC